MYRWVSGWVGVGIYIVVYTLSAPPYVQVGVRLGGGGGGYIYCGIYIVCASSCTGGCPVGWGWG